MRMKTILICMIILAMSFVLGVSFTGPPDIDKAMNEISINPTGLDVVEIAELNEFCECGNHDAIAVTADAEIINHNEIHETEIYGITAQGNILNLSDQESRLYVRLIKPPNFG